MAPVGISLILCVLSSIQLGYVFSEETIRYEFMEERPTGTSIVNLKNNAKVRQMLGNDPDVIQEVFFTFLNSDSNSKIQHFFNLERWTGLLEFSSVLDRDQPDICRQQVDCLLTLDIAINPPIYFDIIHVHISILDKNDNAPQFPEQRIETTISESSGTGVIFPIVAASDPDSPRNGVVRYHLNAPDEFRLEQQWDSDGTVELKLMLTSLLDREKVSQYQMSVVAEDGGTPSKSGAVQIELFVSDENDNIPQFDQAVYTRTILENQALDEPIVTVHAEDVDANANGFVMYSFNRKSATQYGHMFTIGSESGEIHLVEPLDYEETQFVSLTVVAQDQGPSPRPVYCTVEITVVDTNDFVPLIKLETKSESTEFVHITEHEGSDQFVAHASIRDSDSGDAGRVNCDLNDRTHFNLVNPFDKEYTVYTATDMDREVTAQYVLVLECWDHGSPAQTATATIQVEIDDINDHAPVFSSSEYVSVLPESQAVHTTITQVQARDEDAGRNGEIIYMLERDAGDDFHIDPSSGVITSMVPLDHELVPFRQFHVRAMDGGDDTRYATALVSLTITDEDDNPPEFQQKKYIFSVSENLPGRTEVDKVKATDNDDPPYNNFTYYLDGTEHDLKLFSIDPNTGVIFTKSELNRELVPIYHLIAFAQSDSVPPQSDSAEVEVHVKDENDNPPLISFPKNGNETIYIASSLGVGEEVVRIEATDADDGANGELVYRISDQNDAQEFEIESDTGIIRVRSPLTEYENAVFKLVIMVQDGGLPRKIKVTTLTIVATKRNESYESAVNDGQGGDNITTSASHLHIIIGVVAGCVLISVILVIAIVMMKKRHKKPPKKANGLHFWSENNMAAGGDKEKSHGNGTAPGGDTKLSMGDISLTVKTDVMKQPQLQLGKDDSDSGCADISHTESQGSCDDPDGALQKHNSGSSTNSYPRSPPRRMDSFSNWLHAESYHLNQKGNVYRVSEQHRGGPASPPLSASSGVPGQNNTLNAKKTVRFTEPQNGGQYSEDPVLPPPPPELSPGHHDYYNTAPNTGYYGSQIDMAGDVVHYDAEGSLVIVPDKAAFSTFHQANDGSLV